MADNVLLGDEAVAVAAIDSGITAAYAYPGTPSTEILEYIIARAEKEGSPIASWCANEKTAYEGALGVSFMGRRALVCMKHVGLNVAADPFMNSALLDIKGGLVLAVADDPGMHSSQNEQDSRYFADFARIICLEPADQQEAYDMTREAFDISERFRIPVMLRLVTRLAHSRAVVSVGEAVQQKPLEKSSRPGGWMLLPAMARKNFAALIARQDQLRTFSIDSGWNGLFAEGDEPPFGVITTGIAGNYFGEIAEEISPSPHHLHIGVYPIPEERVRSFAANLEKIVVLEEGYPYVERYLRGILPHSLAVVGKLDGVVPATGELDPDNIRPALGLRERKGPSLGDFQLPQRPPQFCRGCPHADTYTYIREAVAEVGSSAITSDIGCYALGALSPFKVPETIVDMGASIGMAKGAAEAGATNVIAVIGDSTFLHSGVTPLMDAVASNADITVIIVDNGTVAMTGGQDTLFPSSELSKLVEGVGVDPGHVHVVNAHKKYHDENVELLKREVSYRGLSVIISVRECVETMKKKSRGGMLS